jgi:anionic cell wall polymer biosynthesis LytR-Cps2A-Psr (LCP) family protein
MRDLLTGLELDATPCTKLSGITALQLVRARHLEVQRGGVFVADPTGDLGRIERSHALFTIALGQLADVGPNPIELDRLTRIVADDVTVDDGLDLDHLLALARRLAASGGVAAIDDLPVASSTTPAGAAVLELAGDADAVLRHYGGAGPRPDDGVPPVAVAPAVPIHPC